MISPWPLRSNLQHNKQNAISGMALAFSEISVLKNTNIKKIKNSRKATF